MRIKISMNDKGNPPGKAADAELHFDDCDGALSGLKLIGFAVWQRRHGSGLNVTWPARQYSVNGERRSFALLRPIVDSYAQDKIRDLIISAYEAHAEDLAGIEERDRTIAAIAPYSPAPEPTIQTLQEHKIEPAPASARAGLDFTNDEVSRMTPEEQRQNRAEVRAQVNAGRPISLTDILSRSREPEPASDLTTLLQRPTRPTPRGYAPAPSTAQTAIDF